MKVFLSWSTERSRVIAEALRDWLPKVIQAVQPWMSTVDIDRGARWSSDISVELEQTNFGILCLTPENLNSTWIHFEAGALSKTLGKTFVCPYLFGLEPTDLKGPLVQFNAAKANKDDTRKLVLTINDAQETPLAEANITESFEVWWPKLEKAFINLPKVQSEKKYERPEREILEEILELVRGQARERPRMASLGELADFFTSYRTNDSPTASPIDVVFPEGTEVIHPHYGRGKVLKRMVKGKGINLIVKFPRFGEKTFQERFSKLTKL